mgnify:CR=1 FL=1
MAHAVTSIGTCMVKVCSTRDILKIHSRTCATKTKKKWVLWSSCIFHCEPTLWHRTSDIDGGSCCPLLIPRRESHYGPIDLCMSRSTTEIFLLAEQKENSTTVRGFFYICYLSHHFYQIPHEVLNNRWQPLAYRRFNSEIS